MGSFINDVFQMIVTFFISLYSSVVFIFSMVRATLMFDGTLDQAINGITHIFWTSIIIIPTLYALAISSRIKEIVRITELSVNIIKLIFFVA